MNTRKSFLALASLAVLSSSITLSHAQTLTDIVLFRANATGNTNGDSWNTQGSDGIANVYLRDSSFAPVNTGNGANAAININMTTPGDHLYYFAIDDTLNDPNPNRLGMNLYFDNQTAAPQISAKVQRNDLNVTLNSGATSDITGGSVAGANTLSFNTVSNTVTLDTFYYVRGSAMFDGVRKFNDVGNGQRDLIGVMRLRVTPVPAPSSALIVLLGAVPIGGILIKRRRAK